MGARHLTEVQQCLQLEQEALPWCNGPAIVRCTWAALAWIRTQSAKWLAPQAARSPVYNTGSQYRAESNLEMVTEHKIM